MWALELALQLMRKLTYERLALKELRHDFRISKKLA